ncbi:MAG TPA: MgtC/SapB family protein [Vicinamibacteria bacterium]|nr:MgtC/SapB family protein [Vicinamibacteria bacterium]
MPGLDRTLVWGLAAALIVGALVGIERERSKTVSGHIGIGGVRTFILFALAGAVGAWLARTVGSPWVFVATVASVGALAVAGYTAQTRLKPEAVGLTTEMAAIAVCLLGGACTAGYPQVALAAGIAVSAVLAYKQPMHGLVAKLGADDISAGVKLLAATFIVLPLLPNEPVDPWGAIRPQSLWTLVVLIAALSLVGYVATRALGPGRGTALTGLTGGLVSSTAVTLSFARLSREEDRSSADGLAAGLLIAWAVMSMRMVVLAAIVHRPLVQPMILPFGAMTAVTLLAIGLLLRRAGRRPAAPPSAVELRNPFSLRSAISFALLFAAVLLLVAIVRQHFHGTAYYLVAGLAGLTDVDAITLSMAQLARDGGASASTAVGAMVTAALANTLVKCGMIVALATASLRRRVLLATVLIVIAALVSLLLR